MMNSPPDARTQINGRVFDYFCGTGYYTLQNHPQVVKAARDALYKFGIGSATSRTGFGNNPVLHNVEDRAAQFFEAEQALYYGSGYLGNAILLRGLAPHYDRIFIDEQSHYSVMDGAILAGKPVVSFAHCSSGDLAEKLQAELKPGQRPLVISDGVFPNTGVIAPLRAYDELLSTIDGALLCVDDAHALGVLGEKGRGSLEHCGVAGPGRYASGTLSKALGGHGGIITGSSSFIESLRHSSNIYAGSSAVPIPAAAASAEALAVLMAQPELRQQLWRNVAYAKEAFRQLGFDGIPDSPVPIIGLSGKQFALKEIQQYLFKTGIATLFVPDNAYSGVPEGGVLRIAIFSSHTHAQIDRLAQMIERCLTA